MDTKTQVIYLRLPKPIVDALDKIAKRDERTRTAVIKRALAEHAKRSA